MEFHISKVIRHRLKMDDLLFSLSGNVLFANVAASRRLAQRLNELELTPELVPYSTQEAPAGDAPAGISPDVHAAALFAMGLIDELSHALVARYRASIDPHVLEEGIRWFRGQMAPGKMEDLLLHFTEQFPTVAVFRGELSAAAWLAGSTDGISNREVAFEELMLLWLSRSNPAFAPFAVLFEDQTLDQQTAYTQVTSSLADFFATRPAATLDGMTLLDALLAPALASPDSLSGQLEFIRQHWEPYLGEEFKRVLLAIDVLREEEIAIWMRFHPPGAESSRRPGEGPGAAEGYEGDEFVGYDSEFSEFVTGPDGVSRRRRYAVDYQAPLVEYEAFSADQAWMPNVVLIAKNTYVWLEQLSKKYQRHIHRLDQIPEEELQILSARGISGLWLIGLWERSRASRTIKRLCGNSDAVASAYSLMDYRIADDLGGEEAYVRLRDRAARAGLRLASDMVPNHMGVDSEWVIEHPEWFISREESPFPVYRFEGPDLSTDSRIELKLEDHYYDRSDAAVVFRVRHHRDGTTRFMYHGNDGTTFAWNDTAQLDYAKAAVREHVIQVILDVARRFPIIRFDAAMVLAKRHVQRLWFPLPGAGGAIPSRAEDACSQEAFDALMPLEFWREVVDRVAVEVPGTLLLAEAFWLLEGYFVRTLGMHRVYNSAFMNMLRDEENAKYRSYLKKTLEFDPDILKRYVNFMSNPDERTAIDQFGSGDKYFGTSLLLATLPGLPMFGHGQVEGFTERYGMDFKQARLEESPNEGLVARHQALIAPLLRRRHLFAESTNFVMYDFWNDHGVVDENVFAYSNRAGDERALILFNNSYESTHGTVHSSVGFLEKSSGSLQQTSLAGGLDFSDREGMVLAFRDTVVGLEYLRRARDLRDSGLTIGLRGYQHVALIDWRELTPSAAEPWDRLCDALNGAGVYRVEEALQQLRLRPLIDSLRQAVNTGSIAAFATAATAATGKTLVEQTVYDLGQSPKMAAKPSKRSKGKPTGSPEELSSAPTQAPSADAKLLSQKLLDFLRTVDLFGQRLMEAWRAEAPLTPTLAAEPAGIGTTLTPSSVDQDRAERAGVDGAVANSARVESATHLPLLVSAYPKALQAAVQAVLPYASGGAPAEQLWAPVLAWISFQALPAELDGQQAFDALNLRPALAEAFSAVGLQGESAWKAAAQVRILLGVRSEEDLTQGSRATRFWSDPDVRWLAGVSAANGREFLRKESFEELVCWLGLPTLLSETLLRQVRSSGLTHKTKPPELAGRQPKSAIQKNREPQVLAQTIERALQLSQVAAEASYDYRSFLDRIDAGAQVLSAKSEPLPNGSKDLEAESKIPALARSPVKERDQGRSAPPPIRHNDRIE